MDNTQTHGKYISWPILTLMAFVTKSSALMILCITLKPRYDSYHILDLDAFFFMLFPIL